MYTSQMMHDSTGDKVGLGTGGSHVADITFDDA